MGERTTGCPGGSRGARRFRKDRGLSEARGPFGSCDHPSALGLDNMPGRAGVAEQPCPAGQHDARAAHVVQPVGYGAAQPLGRLNALHRGGDLHGLGHRRGHAHGQKSGRSGSLGDTSFRGFRSGVPTWSRAVASTAQEKTAQPCLFAWAGFGSYPASRDKSAMVFGRQPDMGLLSGRCAARMGTGRERRKGRPYAHERGLRAVTHAHERGSPPLLRG